MLTYALTFDDIATGAIADAFTTIAGIDLLAVVSNRIRLRELDVGPSDDAPVDINVALQLRRILSVSSGSGGTGSVVSSTGGGVFRDDRLTEIATTLKRDFTTEPSAYESEPLWQGEINAHGGIMKYWSEEDAPAIVPNQLLGLLVAPRTATAVRLSGTLTYELW